MRIVSGMFRAKKLIPPTHNIRPTLDKVKQALFTKLQFEIKESIVLDLFCGSGALGIEAISRGAKKVVFCDDDKKSIALTKKNLLSLKLNDNLCEIVVKKNNYINFLNNYNAEKFNLIILDPPYENNFYLSALHIIKEKKLLAKNGIIVCERLKKLPLMYDDFKIICTKNYGSVSLDYLEE